MVVPTSIHSVRAQAAEHDASAIMATDKTAGGVITGNLPVALSALSNTRERPLFSPSRRPPAPAVVAAPPGSAPPPPKPAEPDHPLLTLVGTVVGETESMGIFADQTTKQFIRLKTGQDHAGWKLRAVLGREVIFAKDKREATLALPARGETVEAGNAVPLPVVSPLVGIRIIQASDVAPPPPAVSPLTGVRILRASDVQAGNPPPPPAASPLTGVRVIRASDVEAGNAAPPPAASPLTDVRIMRASDVQAGAGSLPAASP